MLARNVPRIQGKQPVEAVITSDDLQGNSLKSISVLHNNDLFIQNPPGACKPYISNHIMVDLIKHGKKVGITSNSYKAIYNLLEKVEGIATEKGVNFHGIKKVNGENDNAVFDGPFTCSETKTDNIKLGTDLFAGTVWTFASPHFDGRLVSLISDQMQLGQPIRAKSALELLLGDHATILAERVIFLGQSCNLGAYHE